MSSYDRACVLGSRVTGLMTIIWYVPLDWDTMWDASAVPESAVVLGPV
jgi:hypothetical protein